MMANLFWQMYFNNTLSQWVLSGDDGAIVYGLTCPFNTGGGNNVFDVILVNTLGVTPPASITISRYSDCTNYSTVCCDPATLPLYLCMSIAGQSGQPYFEKNHVYSIYGGFQMPMGGYNILFTRTSTDTILYTATNTINVNTAFFTGTVTLNWIVECELVCSPNVYNLYLSFFAVPVGIFVYAFSDFVGDYYPFRPTQNYGSVGGTVFLTADFVCDPLSAAYGDGLWAPCFTDNWGFSFGNSLNTIPIKPTPYTMTLTPYNTIADAEAACQYTPQCSCNIVFPIFQCPKYPGFYDMCNFAGDTVSVSLSTTGPCVAPVAWSVSMLPNGLSINPATGHISGVAELPGGFNAYNWDVFVTIVDASGCEAVVVFSWFVEVNFGEVRAESEALPGPSELSDFAAQENTGPRGERLPAPLLRDGPSVPSVSQATAPKAIPVAERSRCQYLGEPTGVTVKCGPCRGNVRIKLLQCNVYGQCSLAKKLPDVACCQGCVSYLPSL